jgi:CRISPR-associated protein Cas2
MKHEDLHEPPEPKCDDPYVVGYSPAIFDPAEERYRNMLHLVAYDIRHPRRLRRVAKVCEDYGLRVEYSVFECDLADEVFERFWSDLGDEIDADEDTILAYRICGSCVQRIVSLGHATRPTNALLYML